MTLSSASAAALKFFNAMHHKNSNQLESCLGAPFQDVLPDGTVVKSASELLALHVRFMRDPKTAFRPFGGEKREFGSSDLEASYESTDGSCGFFRVAAEVDRPEDFLDDESPIVRRYMFLGVFLKNGLVEHIQNTLFAGGES